MNCAESQIKCVINSIQHKGYFELSGFELLRFDANLTP